MILKNVEIKWAKLSPDSPDGGFDGDTPTVEPPGTDT